MIYKAKKKQQITKLSERSADIACVVCKMHYAVCMVRMQLYRNVRRDGEEENDNAASLERYERGKWGERGKPR